MCVLNEIVSIWDVDYVKSIAQKWIRGCAQALADGVNNETLLYVLLVVVAPCKVELFWVYVTGPAFVILLEEPL
jgi:hypothetical protein